MANSFGGKMKLGPKVYDNFWRNWRLCKLISSSSRDCARFHLRYLCGDGVL